MKFFAVLASGVVINSFDNKQHFIKGGFEGCNHPDCVFLTTSKPAAEEQAQSILQKKREEDTAQSLTE